MGTDINTWPIRFKSPSMSTSKMYLSTWVLSIFSPHVWLWEKINCQYQRPVLLHNIQVVRQLKPVCYNLFTLHTIYSHCTQAVTSDPQLAIVVACEWREKTGLTANWLGCIASSLLLLDHLEVKKESTPQNNKNVILRRPSEHFIPVIQKYYNPDIAVFVCVVDCDVVITRWLKHS